MLDDLAVRLRQNVGFATAIVLFCVFYLLYHLSHPKGFSSAVLVQNRDAHFEPVQGESVRLWWEPRHLMRFEA